MTGNQLSGAPEVKSADDVKGAFEDFMGSFAAFREANDERIAQVEGKLGGADVLTVEKVDRIGRALDEQKKAMDRLALKRARPALDRDERNAAAAGEHKDAFHAYLRHGDERGLRTLEAKDMSYGTAADGGYLVPAEIERDIGRRLAAISPIRSIASVRQVSSAVLKKPFATSGFQVGWVGETATRAKTTTPTLAELSFPTAELYAMPAATPSLLEDAVVDLDSWIATEIEAAFAEQEGKAFVTGNGINQPKGFLDYARVAEGSWSWGNIGIVKTGVDGAFPASDPSDILIDLIYTLKAGYRQNASFVMNRKTQAAVRKLKDGDDNYIWTPPAVPGGKAMLAGFPVVEAEDMPDIAADAASIAFGDFQRGYLVVDRTGVRVLRDPYSAKPFVLFYTTKRVGGGVQDFDAIKLLSFGD